MQSTDNTEGTKSTLEQLKEARDAVRNQVVSGAAANTDADEDELPGGSAPLTVAAAPAAVEEETPPEEEAPAAAPTEEEGLIRIGDQTFKSQAEAIRYAEKLEHDLLVNSAYNEGIRDSMKASAPAVTAPPEEDNFDEEFYANPKEALAKVQARATSAAVELIKTEQNREKVWSNFFEEYPDLADSRKMCEQVLQENWTTLGAMTDLPKAMKILATKTRSIFQDYIDKTKPRTELSNKPVQVLSQSGNAPKSVTTTKKTEETLDFASQMRKLRTRT